MKAKTKKIAGGINYEAFKKEALQNELIQNKVDLNKIEVSEKGELVIDGSVMATAEGVVEKQLVKQVLNINPNLQKEMGKNLGAKLTSNIVNLVKAGKGKKENLLTVIGNPMTKTITHIIPGNKDFMTNRHALDMLEKTLNVSNDLTLVNAIVNRNGGFECNVRKDYVANVTGKSGKLVVGEEFNPGYAFRNEPMHGMSVSHYAERLVCANGMTSRRIKGEFNTLDILEEGAIKKFFQNFVQMSSSNFIPAQYPLQIEKAMNTRISFNELLEARNIMFRNSDLKEDMLRQYLPEFLAAAQRLSLQGFDYAKCTTDQLKSYITSYNMWDVINRLTDFGSHDYGFNANFIEIQKAAGKLFNKDTYDAENVLIINP